MASRSFLLRTLNSFKRFNYDLLSNNQLRTFASSSSIFKTNNSNLFNSKQVLHQPNLELNKILVRNYSHVPYTRDMIEQRVLLVLRLCDKIDPSKLTLDSNFTQDLGLDSLDQVDMVIAMEDEFGFEIPDEDGEFLVTPKHVVQYVCDKFDVFH